MWDRNSFTREKLLILGSTPWVVRHEGSFPLNYQLRLNIWGRITNKMGLVRNVAGG